MSKFVAVSGSLNLGFEFWGPFDNEADAARLLDSGPRQHNDESDVVELVLAKLDEPAWEKNENDEPHVVAVGQFWQGYKVYGPFACHEEAEKACECFGEKAVALRLTNPD